MRLLMAERVDLGELLDGYTDREHSPRPRPVPALRDPPADMGLVITGPPGPPPSWVITEPPHPGQMNLADLPGTPAPALCFDRDGAYVIDPRTGERVNVTMNCQGCGNVHPGSLSTTAADHRWLCDTCRGAG